MKVIILYRDIQIDTYRSYSAKSKFINRRTFLLHSVSLCVVSAPVVDYGFVPVMWSNVKGDVHLREPVRRKVVYKVFLEDFLVRI